MKSETDLQRLLNEVEYERALKKELGYLNTEPARKLLIILFRGIGGNI